MFYGHYDVMPPDPLEQWETPPFDPQIRGGELFGRGTADDKGQALMQINAIEAYLKVKGALPINAIFAYEGEEEEGSVRPRGTAGQPQGVVTGRRCRRLRLPLLHARLPLDLLRPSRHRCGGDSRHRPLTATCTPATSAAPSPTRPKRSPALSTTSRAATAASPSTVSTTTFSSSRMRSERPTPNCPSSSPEFLDDLGVSEPYGEDGFTTLERIWARPTLEVNGMGGGFQGDGSKTIIPSGAFVKLSMRLVPNQDPGKILDALEEHVMKHAPAGVDVVVEKGHFGYPFLAPIDNPHVDAGRRAMEKGFGGKVFYIRDGASIPIVTSLQKKLGATCLLLGIDVPDGRIHAPNEKLVLANFYGGMEMIAYLLEEI